MPAEVSPALFPVNQNSGEEGQDLGLGARAAPSPVVSPEGGGLLEGKAGRNAGAPPRAPSVAATIWARLFPGRGCRGREGKKAGDGGRKVSWLVGGKEKESRQRGLS